uniref:Uncharacterized protein n=1 Tax=Heterorhabditis bacteriophora TaxID=37862 RepID=A0A1I7WC75_HETBA
MDSIREPMAFRPVAGPRRSSKTLPETEVASKDGHGPCLVVDEWSHPLQLLDCWRNHHSGGVLARNQQNAPRTTTNEGAYKYTGNTALFVRYSSVVQIKYNDMDLAV